MKLAESFMIFAIAWINADAATAGVMKAPPFRLELRGAEVEAKPPAGHHFNVKAPMKMLLGVNQLRPSQADEGKILFKVKADQLPGKSADGTVSLYLCDEKNTYCERHDVPVTVEQSALPSKGKEKMSPRSNVEEKHATPRVTQGFIVNDAPKALALALREKKPLFIDFYGIWCPPCNQLEAEVFASEEFQKSSSRFVLLKLDADSDASWELKSRYRVGGYPTVVFTNETGDEVHRVVGFPGKAMFLSEVEKAWKLRSSPVLAGGDPERLGLLHLERKEFALAKEFLMKVPGKREALLSAEIGILDSGGKRDELVRALERANAEFPKSISSIERRMRLAELAGEAGQKEKRTELLKDIVKVAGGFLSGESPLEKDYQKEDIFQLLADTHSELGDSESARKSWQEAAAIYAKKSRSIQDRGYQLERAYCLWKSGDFDSAEKIYRKLEERFPGEFTFYYSHATMNFDRRKYSDATQQARAALERSYGDNRLRAAHLLAKVLKADAKAAEAKRVIETALSEARKPSDESIRTTRYIANLEKMKAELN